MEPAHPLAKYRAANGDMSMTELGRLLGVDKGTVSRWESGERFPDRDLWPRIRELTGIGVEELSEALASREAAE